MTSTGRLEPGKHELTFFGTYAETWKVGNSRRPIAVHVWNVTDDKERAERDHAEFVRTSGRVRDYQDGNGKTQLRNVRQVSRTVVIEAGAWVSEDDDFEQLPLSES